MTDYIAKAEQDTLAEILTWVQEVVEGRGQSISQLIITVVLGCVPGVGQALDVYNILRALYQLTRNNEKSDNWMELALCLIALVPGFGDALKNVFRMLCSGKSMGRILDSLSTKVRGEIEKWFRQLNWAAYTAELIGHANRILDGLIDLLGGRVARWVLDTKGLQRLIAQLKVLKGKASQKITEAMDSLKHAHQQAMMQPLPNTTAHVPARPSAPPRPAPGSKAPAPKPAPSPPKPSIGPTSPAPSTKPAQAPRTTPSPPAKKPADTPSNRSLPANTGGTATPRQGQATGQQRQSQRSNYSRHKVGVQGEHIADYYFVKNKKTREKINNKGVLYEGRQPGHQGIDHVWFSKSDGNTYRISDTKGTNEPIFKKLKSIVEVKNALMDGLELVVDDGDEAKVRNSVGKTKGDGRQMSHRWIATKINDAMISPKHGGLVIKIRAWKRSDFDAATYPYQRSLITVIGPNFIKHDDNARKKSANNTPPAGKCRKPENRHQIANEFLIPANILTE